MPSPSTIAGIRWFSKHGRWWLKTILARQYSYTAHYLQDWLTDPNVYSWRLDPRKGGASSTLADIGSHWCDVAEHISGARITEVLADLTTIVKTRYSSRDSAEAFSSSQSGNRAPVQIEAEDLASVLLRFDNGARGCFLVGQVLPGHKNELQIEVNGGSGSLRWNQKRQNELWIGRYDRPNSIMAKDPSLMTPGSRRYAHLPGGHQEGWPDAFRNVIADIYSWILTGNSPQSVCTFRNGYRVCPIIDAILQSHHAGGVWQSVGPSAESTSSNRSIPEAQNTKQKMDPS
jgi:predicted dehydrogenase